MQSPTTVAVLGQIFKQSVECFSTPGDDEVQISIALRLTFAQTSTYSLVAGAVSQDVRA